MWDQTFLQFLKQFGWEGDFEISVCVRTREFKRIAGHSDGKGLPHKFELQWMLAKEDDSDQLVHEICLSTPMPYDPEKRLGIPKPWLTCWASHPEDLMLHANQWQDWMIEIIRNFQAGIRAGGDLRGI